MSKNIDPPYNLGKKDFQYNDKFVNEEDGFKHSKWLSFMNERLIAAHYLLKENGIVGISIDENEYAPLKLLCDDIFGESNRLITLHIQVRYENKSLNEKNDWQPLMEYVLIYSKNSSKMKANRPKKTYGLEKFNYKIIELDKGEQFVAGDRNITVFKKGSWKITKEAKAKILSLGVRSDNESAIHLYEKFGFKK